ncbi:MAG: hypothetical protein FWF22_07415, partial [Treponema sp.]|nr:hypothetical protein [Treponema sp.]
QMFDKVVFICPKDRIENWIQYLATGTTDENMEGPRIKKSKRSEGNGPASCKKMPPAGDIQRCITPFS